MMSRMMNHLRTYGIKRSARKLLIKVISRSRIVRDIDTVKIQVSRELDRRFGSQVCYGPLKGYRFSPESWWSIPDRAGMLLGLYEQEVLEVLVKWAKDRSIFVDIGAADGYYGVGCVSQGFFQKSYCFEIAEAGRKVIASNAILNGVVNKVEIRGAADATTLSLIPKNEIVESVVLIDIEGAEFDFLTNSVLENLKSAIIIIEMHEWVLRGDAERLAAFKAQLETYFFLEEIRTGSRDLSRFPEVETISDNDRWLICSERRVYPGKWWVLTPKITAGQS